MMFSSVVRSAWLPLLSAVCLPAFGQAHGPDEGDAAEALDLFDENVEENASGWSQFTASVGYMWLEADGRFDVVGANGDRVTVINFDRLGVDDEDGSPWITLNWRSRSSKWGAWFGHWNFNGAGYRIWEEELETGDGTIVPIGAAVATEISTDWYILEATYSFLQDDNWDIGLGAGFHVVDIDATLAVGSQVGETVRVDSVSRLDSLAPLPNLLGYVHYRWGDRWHFTARYGWFGLSYQEYDGQMTNFHAIARYNLSDRWALEGGYQFVKLDIEIDEESYTGVFDLDFNGPLAGIRFNF